MGLGSSNNKAINNQVKKPVVFESEDKDFEESVYIGHFPCSDCGSIDNLGLYQKESGAIDGVCWGSCDPQFKSIKWVEDNVEIDLTVKHPSRKAEPLLQAEIDKIKAETNHKGKGYRSLPDQVYEHCGVRHYTNHKGDVVQQLYPTYLPTESDGIYEHVGYKIRVVSPKDFYARGICNSKCALQGENLYKAGQSKKVIIATGDTDRMAAMVILGTYAKKRGSKFAPTPVVSPTTGESSAVQQIKNRYEWLDSFDEILVIFDEDKAGAKGAQDIADVFPLGKVKKILLKDDPNKLYAEGRSDEFISAFFAAKELTGMGIKSSAGMMKDLMEYAALPKIPLPPFMGDIEKMTYGGFSLGWIVFLGGVTSGGKSAITDQMLHYWIFNSPYKFSVLSFEAGSGVYFSKLLSHHAKTKISNMLPEDRVNFLESDFAQSKADELMYREDGDPRFYFIEDVSTVEKIQASIEYQIKALDVKFIIIDPLSDLIASLGNDLQEGFMNFQKAMVKKYTVTFFNVAHTRKPKDESAAPLIPSEFAIHGSSSQPKSSHFTMMIGRDKMAEDSVERNTTIIEVPKNRDHSETGFGTKLYYDSSTHNLMKMSDELLGELKNKGARSTTPQLIEEKPKEKPEPKETTPEELPDALAEKMDWED